jgi:hypothetical protein
VNDFALSCFSHFCQAFLVTRSACIAIAVVSGTLFANLKCEPEILFTTLHLSRR